MACGLLSAPQETPELLKWEVTSCQITTVTNLLLISISIPVAFVVFLPKESLYYCDKRGNLLQILICLIKNKTIRKTLNLMKGLQNTITMYKSDHWFSKGSTFGHRFDLLQKDRTKPDIFSLYFIHVVLR